MKIIVSCDCGNKFHCSECVVKKDIVDVLRPYVAFGVVDFIKCSLVKKEKKDKK